MWAEISSYHWGWMGFGIIHMILIWSFFGLAIVSMVRFVFLDDRQKPVLVEESPLEVLKLRYARGGLTKAQYLELKKELQEE